ncbi:LDB19 [Candida pseudojiufengensis]|uniref:LDB19 n=1 Tax=Candida pseudojiufengensis TaxID=497109 RepID=UPI002224CA0D|nr:LDB19 [Candida pseudojiufengensis]KAI5960583.1 LDB19 [Candida pseudojiufengensis]
MAFLSKVFGDKSNSQSNINTNTNIHPIASSQTKSPESSPRSSSNLTPMNSSTSTTSSIIPSKSPSSTLQQKSSSTNNSTLNNYSVSITLESPPIILYGNPSESTGSIISGLLRLITITNIELEKVTLSLVQTMKYTKPFILPNTSGITNCKDCTIRKEELARWDVLTSPSNFQPGNHAYPFSHLLPGSLPPTSKLGSSNSNSFIKYDLIAEIIAVDSLQNKKLILPINISRSILRGPDRNSLRIFPPTEVTASAVLPNVIYPKSTFPIELKLDNLVSNNQQRRWRMRKLNWRIEEDIKIRSNICNKHKLKLEQFEKLYQKQPQKREKTSGMHHSTIHTHISYIRDPSFQNSSNNIDNNNEQPEDQIINNENHDIEETLRSGPSNAHQNFLEDFGNSSGHEINQNQNQNQTQNQTQTQTQIQNQNLNTNETNNPLTPQNSTTPQSEQQKHIYFEETRTISYGEIKSGWKSDFTGKGRIELVANINANKFSTGSNNHITKANTEDSNSNKDEDNETFNNGANISCDIDDLNLGIFVNHTLIVEVVVAEELIHNVENKNNKNLNNLRPVISNSRGGSTISTSRRRSSSSAGSHYGNNSPILTPHTSNPQTSTTSSSSNSNSNSNNQQQQSQNVAMGVPTGAARVLRMQFKLPITERSGLGIAWDDEVPPTYEDVRTLSPPNYNDPFKILNNTPTSSSSGVQEERLTPNILYGRGDTPLVGSFALHSQISHSSIDGIVDNIQELSI